MLSQTPHIYLIPNRCLGCEECVQACGKAHDMEPRNFVLRVAGIPVPMRCAQCTDPFCMAACPSKAITKLEDGRVVIDHELCIQCRNCYYACPYGMITISPTLNKPIKCDLCHDGIEKGIYKEPVCVANCALQALYFGTLDQLQEDIDRQISAQIIGDDHMVIEIVGYKEA